MDSCRRVSNCRARSDFTLHCDWPILDGVPSQGLSGSGKMLQGQILKGRYRIYDRLASGSVSDVYLGRDQLTGLMVVVKVVHDDFITKGFVGRFAREMELLESLDNPHVVKVYSWAVEEAIPQINRSMTFCVMEFVEGQTLAEVIDTRGKLPEADALEIAQQIADG